MHSTETAPLTDLLAELDADGEHAASNGENDQKQARPYRSSGQDMHFRSDKPLRSDKPPRSDRPLRSEKPPRSTRLARSVAPFLFAVFAGIGGTLAAQSYRDEMPFGLLSPVSTMTPPVPSVTTADLQEGLKPLAVDLALVRRNVEQLGSNLDQLARKQDQLAQNMATLQAANQEASQKVSAPPPPHKPIHVPVPAPKSLQPPAQ